MRRGRYKKGEIVHLRYGFEIRRCKIKHAFEDFDGNIHYVLRLDLWDNHLPNLIMGGMRIELDHEDLLRRLRTET